MQLKRVGSPIGSVPSNTRRLTIYGVMSCVQGTGAATGVATGCTVDARTGRGDGGAAGVVGVA